MNLKLAQNSQRKLFYNHCCFTKKCWRLLFPGPVHLSPVKGLYGINFISYFWHKVNILPLLQPPRCSLTVRPLQSSPLAARPQGHHNHCHHCHHHHHCHQGHHHHHCHHRHHHHHHCHHRHHRHHFQHRHHEKNVAQYHLYISHLKCCSGHRDEARH